MTKHAFDRAEDVEDLLTMLHRHRSSGSLDVRESLEFETIPSGMLWVKVPPGGIPALTGAHPGTPGVASDCEVWYSDDDDDLPYQLDDVDGNPLTIDVWHYGPKAIPELDGSGNPRMIKVHREGSRQVAVVDYCQS